MTNFSARYSSRCGCSSQVKLFAQQRGVPCCNQPLQAPPSACCEPHIKIEVPSVCFRPTCAVAATDEHFYIAFKNTCDQEVPISLGNVFFFDQAAGYLNIHLFNGTSYEVSLVDSTKVGQVIEEDACVLVTTGLSADAPTTQRCLSGNFVAPALNATGTIYILNGSAIAVGSTITFTAGGETGSYMVTAFVSASGNIYVYTVENTGSGLTPGVIVDGGPANSCLVPIEVVQDIDLCDLSEAEEVDSLTGCLNGSPRAFVSVGEDYVPRGNGDGGWDQAKFTNFDCCVFTEGCVKFSGNGCTEAQDTFIVAAGVGIECFTAAWDSAGENNAILTATIGSDASKLNIIVLNWDEETRTMTAKPADDDYLPPGEEFVEFCDPGTPICLGECCRQCTWGPQTTDIFVADPEAPMTDSTFIVGPVSLAYDDASPRHYLVGYAFDTGATTSLEITSTYNDNAAPPTGKPFITDPLVIRQKVCNTHPLGCTQDAQLEYNYELRLGGNLIPEELIVHWELGSFVSASATLADNVTPNPYSEPSSQAAAAGQMVGISLTQTDLDQTAIGFGGGTDTKTFPFTAGFFKDHAQLKDCRCAECIVWLYVLLSPQKTITPGSITITLALRRYIVKTLTNDIVLPNNDPDSQGWNS